MCVVIDADTFSEISDNDNKDFEPLRKWVSQDRHTVIHGGSKYEEELSKHSKFRRYLKGLASAGSTYKLNDQEVNGTRTFLESNFVSTKYNDHHIAAIIFISGCKVVSSHDQGLHQLIKKCCSNNGKSLITRSMPNLIVNKAKIYQEESHKSFLKDNSISHCCI